MKKNFIHKLATIMLLVFCGQVLASPLFSCCAEMEHEQKSSLDMDYQTLESGSHNHVDGMIVSDLAHNHDSMSDKSNTQECNHMCDFCLGSVSSISREPEVFTKVETSIVKGSSYTFFNTSSHLDTPFRPPIIA